MTSMPLRLPLTAFFAAALAAGALSGCGTSDDKMASFLVAPARVVDFQRALTEMVNKYEPSGFKFDFTGPWPPYHFVGERSP